ncbi:transposase, partial [Bradyrhizobium sp.]|uniref:transposase n=1 Tax=Bradyrhizobium sp. TaxID=376 RepID=UPI0039672CD3
MSPAGLRRRRWSAESKARIVAESQAPGAVVSEVARRHGLSPSQLSAWRKAARDRGTGPAARSGAGTVAIPASDGELAGVLLGPGP